MKSTSSIKPSIFMRWWRVLTHPSAETFASEIADANWHLTLQGLAILLIYSIVYIAAIVGLSLMQVKPFADFKAIHISTYLFIVIDAIIMSGVIHIISRISRVKVGSYSVQAHAYFLYIVPLIILSSLLSMMLYIWGLVVFVAMLYWAVLTYFMVIAVYGFDKLHARETAVLTLIFAWIVLLFGLFRLTAYL